MGKVEGVARTAFLGLLLYAVSRPFASGQVVTGEGPSI